MIGQSGQCILIYDGWLAWKCILPLVGYHIEVELNQDRIVDDIQAEIINTIDLDNDSIEVEVDNILTEMLNEKNS